ncbi:hypothetical protein CK203_100350 [Vitis vinifera]|uniref:DUF569 domain-containing protein n=1 Tax=Vitis vinifera TaxID=29760 RepID=A0A438D758_VITVI|nr:hypothetical protein CK203_100350 [Vitis vinifera]
MELFRTAKAVTLRSHLDKYLVADDDKETVRQSRNGLSRRAKWLVEGSGHVIRLKSCHGRYLTASDTAYLLGMTGKKVKFKTRGGKFLRANGGTPPWRNSVTHDYPNSSATRNWILWDVEPWKCRKLIQWRTTYLRCRAFLRFPMISLVRSRRRRCR